MQTRADQFERSRGWPRRRANERGPRVAWTGLLAAGTMLLAAPSVARAIAVGELDDFQSGTTENWVMALLGATPPFPPVAVANAGPDGAGDFALRVTATGSIVGPGGRLVVNNVASRWLGNYTLAGVTGLMLDVRNPNAFPLTLRVGLDGPAIGASGGRWLSHGVAVPASSGWRTVTFSLLAQDLVPGNVEATSASLTRANVGVLRVMHSPAEDWTSTPVTGTLELDAIEALPEPSAAIGSLAGALALGGLAALRGRHGLRVNDAGPGGDPRDGRGERS